MTKQLGFVLAKENCIKDHEKELETWFLPGKWSY